MSLARGARLGGDEIRSQIGSGGIAESHLFDRAQAPERSVSGRFRANLASACSSRAGSELALRMPSHPAATVRRRWRRAVIRQEAGMFRRQVLYSCSQWFVPPQAAAGPIRRPLPPVLFRRHRIPGSRTLHQRRCGGNSALGIFDVPSAPCRCRSLSPGRRCRIGPSLPCPPPAARGKALSTSLSPRVRVGVGNVSGRRSRRLRARG